VEFDFRTRRIAAVCMIVTCSLLNVAAGDALTFLCIGYVAFFNFVVLLCSAALIIFIFTSPFCTLYAENRVVLPVPGPLHHLAAARGHRGLLRVDQRRQR
jgi:hypothetical protein